MKLAHFYQYIHLYCQLSFKPWPNHTLVWLYHNMVKVCNKHLLLNDKECKDDMGDGGVLILPNRYGKNPSKSELIFLKTSIGYNDCMSEWQAIPLFSRTNYGTILQKSLHQTT